MSGLDVYRITDQLDDQISGVLVTRLEARGKHPAFVSMMDQYLDAMSIDTVKSVLDLGCGTGVAARAIIRRPGFTGKVLGIDRSSFLVRAATRFAEDEGVASRVEFRVGDTHSLALSDSAFDAIIAHTLISHVDEPLTVLKEARRIVRSGGMLGIFDGDYASMTFAQDDMEQGQRDDEAIITALVTNPHVMRQMPRLIQEAGLQLVACHPHVIADIGHMDFWAPAIESFRKLLPKSGAWSEAKANAWADAMVRTSTEGRFYGATNFCAYVLSRP